MKRILYVFLSIILAFSLVACSNNASNTQNSDTANSSNHISNAETDEEQIAPNKKVLVVYYSATGSTRSVAETIAGTLGADIFEIVPQEPYTREDLDWTDDNSRVSVEHNDESKRDVPLTKTTPDNWDRYDTVYIGYPIWWGIAAWPVNGFVEANDFTNKTVIPFCTSASSDIADSGELLKEAAGTGNWTKGKRFSSNAAEKEITDWISEITAF